MLWLLIADDNFDHSPVTSSKPAVYEVNPGVPSGIFNILAITDINAY